MEGKEEDGSKRIKKEVGIHLGKSGAKGKRGEAWRLNTSIGIYSSPGP